jgi:arylsulfatase A-like enzyme
VVLTADHGEEFGEHGGEGHGRTLHREVVQIPLLLHVPGVEAGRVSEPVSSLDVVPTLLELLGQEPARPTAGRSLVRALHGDRLPDVPVIAELGLNPNNRVDSIRLGGWKLVRQRKTGRVLLFDVVSDPGEQEDLSQRKPRVVARLQERRDREVAEADALGAQFERAGPVALSDEELARLRALGYVDGP